MNIECAKPTRVLVIDDDHDEYYLVKQTLSKSKGNEHQILHVYNIAEATNLLNSVRFDVILLDLNLGTTNGLESVRQLMKYVEATPVIVFTTSDDNALGKEAIKEGAADFIPKTEVSASLLERSISYSIERLGLIKQLKEQVHKDYLTSLHGRYSLFERLNFLINLSNRSMNTFAIVLLDIDNFKKVNDSYGHNIGDSLLIQFSERLKKNIRVSDMAARLAGDEFVLLYTNYGTKENLMNIIENKFNELTQPYSYEVEDSTMKLIIGVSAGVCEWNKNMDAKSLLHLADNAMYQSKRKGKNQITYQVPD